MTRKQWITKRVCGYGIVYLAFLAFCIWAQGPLVGFFVSLLSVIAVTVILALIALVLWLMFDISLPLIVPPPKKSSGCSSCSCGGKCHE